MTPPLARCKCGAYALPDLRHRETDHPCCARCHILSWVGHEWCLNEIEKLNVSAATATLAASALAEALAEAIVHVDERLIDELMVPLAAWRKAPQ